MFSPTVCVHFKEWKRIYFFYCAQCKLSTISFLYSLDYRKQNTLGDDGLVESLKVGDVSVNRGEMKLGLIKGIELWDGTRVNIPIILVNGTRDGPVLLLMSTQHGDEIQGIEVIRQVTRVRVDPKKLKGSIIGIPVGNPLAFQHGLYTSWIDNADVGR